MTDITAEQVRQLNDGEFLAHLHKFPYLSQWSDQEAIKVSEYRLALIQGNRYMKTGNIKSLFTR